MLLGNDGKGLNSLINKITSKLDSGIKEGHIKQEDLMADAQKMIGENVGLEKIQSHTFRELYRYEGRFHLILENHFKRINQKLSPYHPFKVTSKNKGHEIRMIFKKNQSISD